MKLSQFKFKLPEEQVALEPVQHRDECRLMVLHRKSGRIEMTKKDENGEDLLDEEGNPVYLDFRNILDYFDEDDTFIFNDTQVFLPVSMVPRRRPMPRSRCSCCASSTPTCVCGMYS